jgi:hypothetical protein
MVCATLLLVPASLGAGTGPFIAKKHHLFFGGECWFLDLSGPAYREEAVRKAAEDKLEDPKPEALAAARRDEVEFVVWAKSEMDCGNLTAPERIVMEDSAAKRTPLPLKVEVSIKKNAFGAEASFATGTARLPTPDLKRTMATGGKLHVVFEGGPPVSWDAPADKMALLWDDLAPVLAQLATVKTMFEGACEPTADSSMQVANLEQIQEELKSFPPASADRVTALTTGHSACLLRILTQPSDGPKVPASQLLAGTKRAEYLPALQQACATAKPGPREEICAAAAELKGR